MNYHAHPSDIPVVPNALRVHPYKPPQFDRCKGLNVLAAADDGTAIHLKEILLTIYMHRNMTLESGILLSIYVDLA